MSSTIEKMGYDNDSADLVYQSNFGNIPSGTTYLHYPAVPKEDCKAITPWDNTNFKESIKSALSTTSPLFATGTNYTSTSGSIPVLLFPSYVDANLYDLTRRDTPLASGLLPRITNRGIFADVVKRTALPSAVFKPESAALIGAVSTYTRAVKSMKYMYATGEITGPMLKASEVWQSGLQLETEAQFRALKELEENCIINGNPTSGVTTGGVTDENAFTGLIQTITTNSTSLSAATITLDKIRDGIRTIREAKGHPNLIVTDYKTMDDIKKLIQDQLRYTGSYSIAWGITAIEFEGVPVITDLFMPTTAGVRELLILDTTMNNIQLRVLQDATFEELAKTYDGYKFMIKQYMTLLVVNEAWCYRYHTGA